MTSRRDPRNPVRVLEIGSLKAEVYETKAEGRRYEFTADKGGKIIVYRHELAPLALLAELFYRENRDGVDYLAELETARKAVGA